MNGSTLRWAVGCLLVITGTMMLVVPHQFTSIAYNVIRPHLDMWGVAFLLPGICLLTVEVLAPPRFFEVISHLAAGAVLVALAYSFTLMENWPPVPNYGFLGIGTALVPFTARTRKPSGDGCGDMLPISSGAGAAVLGFALLAMGQRFTSPVFDAFRPHMTWLGVLFLVGGASALYVQLRLTLDRRVFIAGHLLLGTALVAFCLTSAIPLRAWLGIVYYGGFGIVVAMVPWLGRVVQRIDPSSLRTRLAFAFAVSVGLPPIVVVSLARHFAGDGSPATDSGWDFSFLLLIGFVALSALGGVYIAGRIARPLGALSLAAKRLTHGDSNANLPVSSLTEVGQLAETFREMRSELVTKTAERERLLAAEAEARNRAEETAKMRDEFMSIAAHELKTPVTSLMGFSQLLRREARKNSGQLDVERVLASAERIEEQSRRLTRLTNQLLDLSRLETGKLGLEREERNLGALIEDLVSTIRQSHPHRTITVQAEEITICADALRLEQVLTNLIDNALKFSKEDAPVEVTAGMDGEEWARIEVRDHGIGIPDEKKEHVFERFYQAHAEQYYGGMGIGLFVSRQIIDMHGGEISIEQPEGEGTRFVVRLPLGGC